MLVDNTPREVVLPADMYDALELTAYAFGGVGAFHFCDLADGETLADGITRRVEVCPRCLIGHARWAENDFTGNGRIERALRAQGLGVCENDRVVTEAFGADYDDTFAEDIVDRRRLSWKKYVKLANIVRVDG